MQLEGIPVSTTMPEAIKVKIFLNVCITQLFALTF